ncbi:MAG: M20/M25/M40 family metallo-hydrolase [Acidobacteria bacterium]|nr:M20/M25/M40 family metallo-hydrolase [Acidobacteriota bacterium]
MLRRRMVLTTLAVGMVLCTQIAAAADSSDLAVVHRIRQEAMEHSQVMDHLFFLTDVHGPRLTNSPGFAAAATWVAERTKQYGLSHVALEKWDPFGRGWAASRFSVHLVEPQYSTLIGAPIPWSPATDGVVAGTPMLAPLRPDNDLERYRAELDRYYAEYKGRLRNQIILFRDARKLQLQTDPASRRYTASELSDRAAAPEPIEPIEIDLNNPVIPSDPDLRRRFNAYAPGYILDRIRKQREEILNGLNQFLVDEGVRLVIYPSGFGDGGTIFPPTGGFSYKKEAPLPPPSLALTPEHYNRIVRLIERKQPVRIEAEIESKFYEDTSHSLNVVAEIPGGSKSAELVIIGGHLDSWDFATGATDNAAGCAVMIEVMRILKTLDLKMDRTVRMVLWGGEEQGLLGSEAYVKTHFADPATMELKPEHAKVSAYFNLDNGSGKIRGVYLQGNDMVRPIFDAWLSPFRDLGATTLSIRKTGSTDHLSFEDVGIPGFQFIQDPLEYNTRTHHSNMDVYDRIQPADLMEAAAIIASFVYHTANRTEMLPRKPLPKPQPKDPEAGGSR